MVVHRVIQQFLLQRGTLIPFLIRLHVRSWPLKLNIIEYINSLGGRRRASIQTSSQYLNQGPSITLILIIYRSEFKLPIRSKVFSI